MQCNWKSWRPPGAGQGLQGMGSDLQLLLPLLNPKCVTWCHTFYFGLNRRVRGEFQ